LVNKNESEQLLMIFIWPLRLRVSLARAPVKLFVSIPWSHIGRLGVQFFSFLTSTLDAYKLSTSHPGRFIPVQVLRCPLNRRLYESPRWNWRIGEEKLSSFKRN